MMNTSLTIKEFKARSSSGRINFERRPSDLDDIKKHEDLFEETWEQFRGIHDVFLEAFANYNEVLMNDFAIAYLHLLRATHEDIPHVKIKVAEYMNKYDAFFDDFRGKLIQVLEHERFSEYLVKRDVFKLTVEITQRMLTAMLYYVQLTAYEDEKKRWNIRIFKGFTPTITTMVALPYLLIVEHGTLILMFEPLEELLRRAFEQSGGPPSKKQMRKIVDAIIYTDLKYTLESEKKNVFTYIDLLDIIGNRKDVIEINYNSKCLQKYIENRLRSLIGMGYEQDKEKGLNVYFFLSMTP